jgi:hypothetical protein
MVTKVSEERDAYMFRVEDVIRSYKQTGMDGGRSQPRKGKRTWHTVSVGPRRLHILFLSRGSE